MSEHLARRLEAMTYHAPSPTMDAIMADMRSNAQGFVTLLDSSIPECREKSLAFTAFEEAMMWAMKALWLTDPESEVISP